RRPCPPLRDAERESAAAPRRPRVARPADRRDGATARRTRRAARGRTEGGDRRCACARPRPERGADAPDLLLVVWARAGGGDPLLPRLRRARRPRALQPLRARALRRGRLPLAVARAALGTGDRAYRGRRRPRRRGGPRRARARLSVALVSGAASGIGAAIARRLGQDGPVVALDRDPAVQELRAA